MNNIEIINDVIQVQIDNEVNNIIVESQQIDVIITPAFIPSIVIEAIDGGEW